MFLGTPILWLCGPPGVGKSTAAWDIYTVLADRGIECAYLDIDQVGICYPAPHFDPERYQVKTRNLRALACNFGRAGAGGLVVSGVENPLAGPHVDSLPRAALVVCQLRANHAELTQRLEQRHGSSVQLDDALRIAEQMDHNDFADVLVDTTGLTSHQVAKHVLKRIADWPARTAPAIRPAPVVPAEVADGPILWLCGPTGVGKSTVGFSAYLSVMRRGLTVAYVDIDQIGFCSGAGLDHGLRARNLASVWKTYRSAGADALVVVGPVQDRAEAAIYEDALPRATFTWCRLQAGREELTKRIMSRQKGGSWPQPGDPLKGQSTERLLRVADQATAEAARSESVGFGVRINSDGLTAEQTAVFILSQLGWPGRLN